MRLNAPLEIVTPKPVAPDRDFIGRLINFYWLQPGVSGFLSEIWAGVHSTFYGALHHALTERDHEAVAAILADAYGDHLMFGIDYGRGVLQEDRIEWYRQQWVKSLAAAAYSAGVIAFPNPEQPEGDGEICADDLLSAIESVIGCRLTATGGAGSFGVRVGDRMVTRKLLDAACIVASLKRLGPFCQAVEIGAGAGALAYLVRQAFPRVVYETIDLPIVSVIHGYLLAHSTAAEQIWFAGELVNGPGAFRIHGLQIAGLNAASCELAINQDSLPEMTPEIQQQHFATLKEVLRPGGFFYSVQHESGAGGQSRVFCAIQKSPVFKQIHRAPYWGREGYVEEIWRR